MPAFIAHVRKRSAGTEPALRHAREQIFKLVEMHTEVSKECDTLRSQLAAARAETSEANSRASEIETRSNWELMAKGRHISELTSQIQALKGDSQFKTPSLISERHAERNPDTPAALSVHGRRCR